VLNCVLVLISCRARRLFLSVDLAGGMLRAVAAARFSLIPVHKVIHRMRCHLRSMAVVVFAIVSVSQVPLVLPVQLQPVKPCLPVFSQCPVKLPIIPGAVRIVNLLRAVTNPLQCRRVMIFQECRQQFGPGGFTIKVSLHPEDFL